MSRRKKKNPQLKLQPRVKVNVQKASYSPVERGPASQEVKVSASCFLSPERRSSRRLVRMVPLASRQVTAKSSYYLHVADDGTEMVLHWPWPNGPYPARAIEVQVWEISGSTALEYATTCDRTGPDYADIPIRPRGTGWVMDDPKKKQGKTLWSRRRVLEVA